MSTLIIILSILLLLMLISTLLYLIQIKMLLESLMSTGLNNHMNVYIEFYNTLIGGTSIDKLVTDFKQELNKPVEGSNQLNTNLESNMGSVRDSLKTLMRQSKNMGKDVSIAVSNAIHKMSVYITKISGPQAIVTVFVEAFLSPSGIGNIIRNGIKGLINILTFNRKGLIRRGISVVGQIYKGNIYDNFVEPLFEVVDAFSQVLPTDIQIEIDNYKRVLTKEYIIRTLNEVVDVHSMNDVKKILLRVYNDVFVTSSKILNLITTNINQL